MTALRAEGCGIAAFGSDEYKVSVTGISSLCFRHPKHGGELATFGGFFPPPLVPLFPRSKGGCTVFPRAKPGFKGFL